MARCAGNVCTARRGPCTLEILDNAWSGSGGKDGTHFRGAKGDNGGCQIPAVCRASGSRVRRVRDDQRPLFCANRASREWIDAGAVTKGWVSGILESFIRVKIDAVRGVVTATGFRQTPLFLKQELFA
jgi:hypothetical protein